MLEEAMLIVINLFGIYLLVTILVAPFYAFLYRKTRARGWAKAFIPALLLFVTGVVLSAGALLYTSPDFSVFRHLLHALLFPLLGTPSLAVLVFLARSYERSHPVKVLDDFDPEDLQ